MGIHNVFELKPEGSEPDPGEGKAAGVWFVYGYDTSPFPMFISVDELSARRYQERLGYPTFLTFWNYDTEFKPR